jgi:hypothetical protein
MLQKVFVEDLDPARYAATLAREAVGEPEPEPESEPESESERERM